VRENIPGNGQAADGGEAACVICEQPLTQPVVKVPDGLAHFACADQPPAEPERPAPPKKRSRIRRGKQA
jgi:hypothetical protein